MIDYVSESTEQWMRGITCQKVVMYEAAQSLRGGPPVMDCAVL
jgi:hypothetical protein